tara:strand:- start:746 stop:1066 length:321 start_codon:yes stop_codon:yes gene_type:complete
LIDSVGLKLITIYLSRLKIIAAHKKDPIIIKKSESKISERAKKHETKAKREVKKIVAPILEYLIISNLGHLYIKLLLAPEQIKRKFTMKLGFFTINFIYIIKLYIT